MERGKDSIDLGIIVGDIKASLNFYQTTLGLEFIESVPVPFGMLHRLRFGTSDVKLVDPKTVPPKGSITLDGQLGFRYLTFVIKNLSGLCSDLKDAGVEFVVSETEIRPGIWIAMVKDPDGNIVEFLEKK